MRHHFLPIFYTTAWAGLDRKLAKFSWEYGAVRASRRGPRDTGYVDDLYLNSEAPPGREQDIELRFMAKTDQRGRDALTKLTAGTELSPKDREGWARFVMSLWRRSPQRVSELPDLMAAHVQQSVEALRAEYPSIRRKTDPESFDEFKNSLTRDSLRRFTSAILPTLIELKGVGQHFINMRWGVVTLKQFKWTLLTSDQPVHRPLPLIDPNAFIALPIGPTAVFFATNSMQRLHHLREQAAHPEFVRLFNAVTCKQADRLVLGDNAGHRRFVENHMRRPPT